MSSIPTPNTNGYQIPAEFEHDIGQEETDEGLGEVIKKVAYIMIGFVVLIIGLILIVVQAVRYVF